MPEDLVGSSDIAKAVGKTVTYINRLALRGDLPEPLGILPSGQRIWKRDDVETWIQEQSRGVER